METTLKPDGFLGSLIKTHLKEVAYAQELYESLCMALENKNLSIAAQAMLKLSICFKFYENSKQINSLQKHE